MIKRKKAKDAEPEVVEPIERMNSKLREAGMPEIAIVSPNELRAQPLNARYMNNQTMELLVKNIRRDSHLESTPLVARVEGVEHLQIVSGHHRVEAAKTAGLEQILVMVINVSSRDELRSKQLSHNALEGRDDLGTLKQLYDSIGDLELKYLSGLKDVVDSVKFTSLQFMTGALKEVTMTFFPEEIEEIDRAMELIRKESFVGRGTVVRVSDRKDFGPFMEAMRRVKKVEHIKSTGAAVCRMVEIVLDYYEKKAEADSGKA